MWCVSHSLDGECVLIQIQLARSAHLRLKTLRHPNILRYIDGIEVSVCVRVCVTVTLTHTHMHHASVICDISCCVVLSYRTVST